jgi:hypothetical protein
MITNKFAEILTNLGVGAGVGVFGLSVTCITKEFYQYLKTSSLSKKNGYGFKNIMFDIDKDDE